MKYWASTLLEKGIYAHEYFIIERLDNAYILRHYDCEEGIAKRVEDTIFNSFGEAFDNYMYLIKTMIYHRYKITHKTEQYLLHIILLHVYLLIL